MKIKINGSIYDSSEAPLMVILSNNDKKNIGAMLPEATCYACFPDGWGDRDQMLAWMETPIVQDHETLLPRKELIDFSQRMEQRLREKDPEKGTSWKQMDERDLMALAVNKSLRLEDAVREESPSRVTHAVDLANYCMMIADNALHAQAEAE